MFRPFYLFRAVQVTACSTFEMKVAVNVCEARRKCHTNDLFSERLRVAETKKKITDLKRVFGPKSDQWNESTVKYLYAAMNNIQRIETIPSVTGQTSKEFELPETYENDEGDRDLEEAVILELPPLQSYDGQDIGVTLSLVKYKNTALTDELTLTIHIATERLPFYAMVSIDFIARPRSDEEAEPYGTVTIFQKIQLMNDELTVNCARYLDYDEQKDRRKGDDDWLSKFCLSVEIVPLAVGYDAIRERLLTILTLETEIKHEEHVHLLYQPEHFEEYVQLYDRAVEQIQSSEMPHFQEAVEDFLSRKARKESIEISIKLMRVMWDAEKKRKPYA